MVDLRSVNNNNNDDNDNDDEDENQVLGGVVNSMRSFVEELRIMHMASMVNLERDSEREEHDNDDSFY